VLWCSLRFPSKNDVGFVLTPICLVGARKIYLCYLYLLTYTGVQHDFHTRLCFCHLTVTQRVSHVDQELLTLPEHPSLPSVFIGVRVSRCLVFCVMFCRSLFVLLSFYIWPFCIYGFWLPLWYLQTIFGSPDPKGHVSYCHHLASVVNFFKNLLLWKY
jgi:hypothetical protein